MIKLKAKDYLIAIILFIFIALSLNCYGAAGPMNVGLTVLINSVEIGNSTQGNESVQGTTQFNASIVLGGANVTFITPVTYLGSGYENVTVDIPFGFENGYNWALFEDGRNITPFVNFTALSLSWLANFSATNVTLYVDVDPPIINTTDVIQTSSYQNDFTITKPDNFINVNYTNVQGNVTINTSYNNFRLYDGNNVDVSSIYGLQTIDGYAIFSGINLTSYSYNFTIRGDLYIPSSEDGGSGGHKHSPIIYTDEYIVIRVIVDETDSRELTIINKGYGSIITDITFEPFIDFLFIDKNILALAPNQVGKIILTVFPEEVGVYYTTLYIEGADSGRLLVKVPVRIEVYDKYTSIPEIMPEEKVKDILEIIEVEYEEKAKSEFPLSLVKAKDYFWGYLLLALFFILLLMVLVEKERRIRLKITSASVKKDLLEATVTYSRIDHNDHDVLLSVLDNDILLFKKKFSHKLDKKTCNYVIDIRSIKSLPAKVFVSAEILDDNRSRSTSMFDKNQIIVMPSVLDTLDVSETLHVPKVKQPGAMSKKKSGKKKGKAKKKKSAKKKTKVKNAGKKKSKKKAVKAKKKKSAKKKAKAKNSGKNKGKKKSKKKTVKSKKKKSAKKKVKAKNSGKKKSKKKAGKSKKKRSGKKKAKKKSKPKKADDSSVFFKD